KVSGLNEVGLVLAGSEDLAREVAGELSDEERVSKLLQQNGREVNVEVGGDAVALEIAQHTQQGQVSLGGNLVQPLDAMRPGPVVDHVRQMRVQREGQEARRSVLCLRQEPPRKIQGEVACSFGWRPARAARCGRAKLWMGRMFPVAYINRATAG